MADCFCIAEFCNINDLDTYRRTFTNQSLTENKSVDKWRNSTNMLSRISAEIQYIRKSFRYEMHHLTQIDKFFFENNNS